MTHMDEEDRRYFDNHFTRVYDKLEEKCDKSTVSALDFKLATTQGEVSKHGQRIAKVEQDSAWHTWAIRLIIIGILTGGGTAAWLIAG